MPGIAAAAAATAAAAGFPSQTTPDAAAAAATPLSLSAAPGSLKVPVDMRASLAFFKGKMLEHSVENP
eukprot:CAMPEP_0119474826 /NCGR_PEP_ID=MMETSP1344-20130328/5932_1 /TAXON_ID=236787 /ORGANISM="Florenciella parvula, Strain CCMP2471" /LENGTH=67 /DNA_ID=CAMNT_0007508195 /DNA_START=57 /DNA_END=258 /DNA_ORIENTATION=-